MTSDWRDDPAWRLVYYDASFYPDGPPATPTKTAELSNPDSWCSEYRGSVIAATWDRLDTRIQG